MNEFVKTLLSLSVSGSLLLLLVLGLKRFYKEKFSRRWQYYIWLIVALRFLLPFTSGITVVGSLFETFETTRITNETSLNSGAPVEGKKVSGSTEPIQTNKNTTASAVLREPLDGYACLFFVWSAVALVLLVRKITIYQGFIQYLKAGNTEAADIKILNLLSDCEEKLNSKARVELYHNPLIVSPMMVGFLHPGIVLPAGELEHKELSYIFLHELIHVRRKDMFYKWLIQVVVCVHWFNPLVYLLEREVNQSCELACDEKVISLLDDKARREYGDTLISFLKSENLYKSSFTSVTLTEGAEQLKERLGAIMKFKKRSQSVMVGAVILTMVVLGGFLAAGAYAAPSAGPDPAAIGKDKHTSTEAFDDPETLMAYEKLIAYKPDDYLQKSIADFNASLASTPDELTELLAAQAAVFASISPDDENYDFIATTMSISASELYCEHMGEAFTFFVNISKKSRPTIWLDEEGERVYDFHCFFDFNVGYSINAPELLTVAERDHILLTFKEEMQDFLDGLSEEEITAGNIRMILTDKAAELADHLSSEKMELSCEVFGIEINDAGRIVSEFIQ